MINHKILFLIPSFLLLLFNLSFAQTTGIHFEDTDSIFINFEGHQLILHHKVKKGQTLYSIKRFYGVAISDLYKSNSFIEEKGLHQNQLLKEIDRM